MRPRLLAVAISVTASACAGATHLTREKPLPTAAGPGSIVLVDAKQRAITNAMVGGTLRACAEPSPDALSAIAASAGLSLSKGDAAKVASNLSLAEGAGSIGIRTQSIQLMRDALFRLCEAYVSSAVDGLAVETLQRRFQSSMVAILAIEQLTGAVRAPAIVLGGTATQGNAEKAAELTAKTEAARKAVADADKDLKDKQVAADKATASREELEKELAALKEKTPATEAKEKANDEARLAELPGLIDKKKADEKTATDAVDAAKTSKANQEASFKMLDEARQVALAGGGSASVSGVASAVAASEASTVAVASAVQEIVKSTLDLQFGRELCTTLLTKAQFSNAATTDKCREYLNETVQTLAGQRQLIADMTPMINKLLEGVAARISDPKADAGTLKAATSMMGAIQALLTQVQSGSAGQQLMLIPQ